MPESKRLYPAREYDVESVCGQQGTTLVWQCILLRDDFLKTEVLAQKQGPGGSLPQQLGWDEMGWRGTLYGGWDVLSRHGLVFLGTSTVLASVLQSSRP